MDFPRQGFHVFLGVGVYERISLPLAPRYPNVSEQGKADLDNGDKEVS